ncbi:cytochrome P450 71AP13-like [Rhodamnia argentea]|uniref:Cytochrome P450 71AP13-like n=1 Tax=Rhodamnia argentea TaxID=178133 RepID=A0A8B8P8Q2_9MYRT|nr:cytochrome P450 71AP13-like [Rhodamnia argentea]
MPLLQDLFLPTCLVLAALLVVFGRSKSGKRKCNLPPSPPKLPIIGNLHQLGKSPHISLHRLARKYGPIMSLQLGEVPTIVVSSAAMAKEVMKTHDLALANRPQTFSAKHLLYDCTDMAFSPYGAYWRYIRKIGILELFSVRRVQSFIHVREEEVARLAHRVAKSCPGTINLSKLLMLYTNNVLCQSAFGRDFSAGGDYDKHGFQKMLEEFQELLGGFNIGDFFPSLEFINSLTGMKSRLQHTFKCFDRFFDEILSEHSNESKATEAHHDIVDVLIDIEKNGYGDMPLTRPNIKALLLDFFAGGTDTTFITLDWAMTELVMKPKAMERAQAELRSVVGGRNSVQEADLPQLPYLKAIIKEVFRLHPPAPMLVPRESMEDITIDGYCIPAKTRFFINAWSIGRDPQSWVDPEKFLPERFLDSTIDFKGQDFELIPFGTGRRSCPAIAFGNASIEIALAQLLHSFDWQLPPGVQPKDLDMDEAFGITMHRIENLVVVAKPRFS